jgi:hypothetical protein
MLFFFFWQSSEQWLGLWLGLGDKHLSLSELVHSFRTFLAFKKIYQIKLKMIYENSYLKKLLSTASSVNSKTKRSDSNEQCGLFQLSSMCRSLSFAESIQEEEMITLKGRLEIYWKRV